MKKNSFLISLSLFTKFIDIKDDSLKNENISYAWNYPFFGLVIGIILSVAYTLAYFLGLSSFSSSVFTVSIALMITGALHEDGFADSMDGIFGANSKEKRLEIMKDSKVGTFGVCAIVLSIIFKVSLLSNLEYPSLIAVALISSSILSRFSMSLLQYISRNSSNSGVLFKLPKVNFLDIFLGIIFSSCILYYIGGIKFVAIMVSVTFLTTVFVSFVFKNKIRGINQDSLGAIQVLVEIKTLSIFVILMYFDLITAYDVKWGFEIIDNITFF